VVARQTDSDETLNVSQETIIEDNMNTSYRLREDGGIIEVVRGPDPSKVRVEMKRGTLEVALYDKSGTVSDRFEIAYLHGRQTVWNFRARRVDVEVPEKGGVASFRVTIG